MFASFIGLICYLSFQNGEAAKELGKNFINNLAKWYYDAAKVSDQSLLEFTYRFRQIGRVVLFILLGVLGTATIHATFHKWNWILRTIISGIILVCIAVFTERFKIYLPTRHFSQTEMLYSIYGVLIGFGLVSVITSVYTFTNYLSTKNKIPN